MKLLTLFLVLAALVCNAQEINDITREVIEQDRDRDGNPDFRSERVYREGKLVMNVWSNADSLGIWSVTMRASFGGGAISVEIDKDRDRFFEKLMMYIPGGKDMEVFTRERDGSMQPVSTQTLRNYKKQYAEDSEKIQELQKK